MTHNIIPLTAFKDNYIWLFSDNAKNAVVVDPGDANPVLDAMQQNNLNLSSILITHHHLDHSGGLEVLKRFFPNVIIYGSHSSPNKFITHRVKDGAGIAALNFNFKVLEIPGHTLDHLAYYTDGVLFCGDTLFSAGCGRVFEGTAQQMYHSLQKLANLPDDTRVYCGHEYTLANLHFAERVEPGNKNIKNKIAQVKKQLADSSCGLPSKLAEERLVNPFLRCEMPEVIAAVEQHVGDKLNNPVQVFHHLREWKNNFV